MLSKLVRQKRVEDALRANGLDFRGVSFSEAFTELRDAFEQLSAALRTSGLFDVLEDLDAALAREARAELRRMSVKPKRERRVETGALRASQKAHRNEALNRKVRPVNMRVNKR